MRIPTISTLLFFTLSLHAQITWQELPSMPEKVSNNAVTAAVVDGIPYVYSFSGIDSTKECSGDHLKSWRYNTMMQEWSAIPSLMDNSGKIAAGASTVNNQIYVIGGYHLASNCAETSSNRIHSYDPVSNTYNFTYIIPTATDDHVQAVWRDSLLYVVTGWSNSGNISDVQVYNPTLHEWFEGTPVPNNDDYKVFGASGAIVGDTLYYIGAQQMIAIRKFVFHLPCF